MKGVMFVLLCFAVSSVSATPGNKHYATMAYVIDSVTYMLDVNVGGHTQRIKFYLAGVESPKLYRSGCEVTAARFAKKFVNELLWPSELLVVSDVRAAQAGLQGNISFDGRDLAQVLVRFNQARPIDSVGSWCNS